MRHCNIAVSSSQGTPSHWHGLRASYKRAKTKVGGHKFNIEIQWMNNYTPNVECKHPRHVKHWSPMDQSQNPDTNHKQRLGFNKLVVVQSNPKPDTNHKPQTLLPLPPSHHHPLPHHPSNPPILCLKLQMMSWPWCLTRV